MTTPVRGPRVRFAPAPSGSLHVGNILTATFNWLYARHHGGTFVFRVEDTDASRVSEDAIAAAIDDLRWMGLDWDEGPGVGGPYGPYRQTEHLDRYREVAGRFLDSGHAYRCYCTSEELAQRRAAALAAGRPPGYDGRCRGLTEAERVGFEVEGRPAVVRFRVPEGETRFTDLVHGDVRFDHALIPDFVIQRADGSPLYLLAAAVDDRDMEITHVIRGEDILSATPRQMMILRALGETGLPAYAHIPLIVGADRAPLSKRHGDTALIAYRKQGFLPEAMMNYLVLLNWSIGDGTTERFTVEELIEHFDLGGVTRNPSAFDVVKLTALNGEKIRALAPEDFVRRIEPLLIDAAVLTADSLDEHRPTLLRIAPLVQERMKRLDEAPGQLRFLFHEVEPDERAAAQLTAARAPQLEAALGILEKIESWDAATIQEALTAWADTAGLKRKEAFQPIRAAVTGSLISPPLFESIEILGRETTARRLREALESARVA